jgi:hypothetical protein
MTLNEDSIRVGNRIFRWHSYLPLFFVPILLSGLSEFGYPKGSHAYDLMCEILCLFLGCLSICLTLRTLKKKTKILHVEGR